ncbi:SMI1/KNR4 family protein [Cellulomonas pakistanensis]|uniref:Knr4/Smi1-like domain-containing protein n=1 Tax=Cellulomonas pakistanensis TaxID=992287 RepID=A0A919PAV6_9CELL|nr:SMI1/KNR4 family protein [Cellulomonas pakistanensis]GIG36256.1 hypothetical protein Cpa01nite_16370 [Cellulomonas pakistanensis]
MRPPDGSPWWEALIGEMVKASTRLTQVAPDAFPLSVPRLGADDESIAAAVERLGHPLDGQHEALLRLANGWELAFLSGSVLGTPELGQGALWEDANASLDMFYAEGDTAGWPPRAGLVPIHASPYDSDVVAVWLGGPVTEGGHPVLYFAGEVIDRWPNVYEWWLRMLVLQERSLAHVLELTGQGLG